MRRQMRVGQRVRGVAALFGVLVVASLSLAEPGSAASGAPLPGAAPELISSPAGVEPVSDPTLENHASSLPTVGAARPLTAPAYDDRWGHARAGANARLDLDKLPGRLSDPALRDLWLAGIAAEREERLIESAETYERIADQVPEESETYWRIARNYWRVGESLPVEDKEGRILYFEKAESWAARGLEIDPDCAACMLWKFVSMGRQATTRGLLSAVRDVREMDALLTRGIELEPDQRDEAGNTTLGNLYYAGAVFYRVIPESWWLRLFVGVRGDKDRSLEYARRAVEISSIRVDYRVELGAVLLCLGATRDEPKRLDEGMRVLREARTLDNYLGTDSLDKDHATTLMTSPQMACGYSRDGFIDIESLKDQARAQR